MFCVEDSLASRSAPPESEKENQTNDSFGLSSSASFAKFGPDGSLRRMSQGYLQSTMDESLAEYSETWPHAGTMRNGPEGIHQKPGNWKVGR